jgi:poly-beta-1,6-N-acetyl-D-glucosamine synthase
LAIPHLEEPHTLVNLFTQMDSLLTAMLYLSFAIKKAPYMGVGRNLSYRKSLFLRVKGFASHLHILSGDDDLFVRDTANLRIRCHQYSSRCHDGNPI